jgi:hypothetical protein
MLADSLVLSIDDDQDTVIDRCGTGLDANEFSEGGDH